MKTYKKIIVLVISFLWVKFTFAQDQKYELNSMLQTNFRICIEDKWYDVSSLDVKYLDGYRLEANIKIYDSAASVTKKEYLISRLLPYYVEDGIWKNIDGEYIQEGNTKLIHFYNNNNYGSSNHFEFKQIKTNGEFGHEIRLKDFYILFYDQDHAKKFVTLVHELQGDDYNSTPWLRTLKESTKYKEQSSKEIFESILKDFRQYDIKSEQVRRNKDWTKTTHLSIKFKYPNIIISHTDVRTTDFNYGNDFSSGTISITFSINDIRFEEGRNSWYSSDEYNMRLFSKSGIEISYKGKKNIIEEYNFYASKIVCKNLLEKLRVFKRKVLDEEYQGQYGFSSSIQKSNSNEQTKKISGGKYVQ